MNNCMLFMDGAYVEKLVKNYGKQINLETLATQLIRNAEGISGNSLNHLRTIYYDALPWYDAENATENEKVRYVGKLNFFLKLQYLSRFIVRQGRTKRNNNDQNTYQQKGVDVLLATDMVYYAATKQMQHCILFSPDADFAPALARVRECGATTYIVSPELSGFSASNESLMNADHKIILTKGTLSMSMLMEDDR